MSATERVWQTRGFADFRQGTFGNAGQNLYVSRAGVLQRIHLFDLNKDGYLDLLFCNAQEHLESPPVFVYREVLGERSRLELPSAGSSTGAVADLNGDGYEDLVLGMEKSGNPGLLNAYLYYGAPEGLSEKYRIHLPAHGATSAAIGDFDGDGRPDLALITQGKLRLFYQSELGFEARAFVDLDVEADQIGAADLDGDGCADLYALSPDGRPRIYWGGPGGLDPERGTEVAAGEATGIGAAEETAQVSEEERVAAVAPLARILELDGIHHLFVPFADRACLVPVGRDRSLGAPLVFGCKHAVSVALGDFDNDGHVDLVFASRDPCGPEECSWVYWGGATGFAEERRAPLPTHWACDVAGGDLNGDGCADIVVCQKQSARNFSIDSLVFRGTPQGIDPEPVRLATHGARRVFIARTADDQHPQVIFVNQLGRNAVGDVDSPVYWGGPEGFAPDRCARLPGRGATAAVACDLNDDGWPDVVLINSSENALHLDPGSYVFLGGPDGFASAPDLVVPTRRGWCACTADLDGDGYLDLIVALFWDPTILIFRGTAGGLDLEHPERLQVQEGAEEFRQTRKICLADLNNDGYLDLIVGNAGLGLCAVLWGGPDGFDPTRRQVLPLNGTAGQPLARDLNNNGYLDLIIGGGKPSLNVPHNSFVHIFWNGPGGLRPERQTQLPSNAVIDLAVADFDKDGYLDLFCCSYTSIAGRDIDSYLYWGGPEGFSAERRTKIPTHSAAGCLAADFDNDGYVDLAVANHKTEGDHIGDSFVLWNGPNGFDLQHPTRLPTSGPHGMLNAKPGNILDNSSQEYYTSTPFELPAGAALTRIAWQADMPPRTWVRAQLRWAPGPEALAPSPWRGPEGESTWFENNQRVEAAVGAGPWVQYRLALGAENSGNTPRITGVSVFYA